MSTIGPSYERFRALTSQLKTSVSKRSAHASQSGDPSLQSGADNASSLGSDSLDGNSNIGKSLRKASGAVGVGLAGQGREVGVGGGGFGGNVRSTRRTTAAAVAAGSVSAGSYEKDDTKTKLSAFGVPVDHPFNTENHRFVPIAIVLQFQI